MCAPLAILAPFCTFLAGKRHFHKLAPILSLPGALAALTLCFDAAKSDLGEGVRKVCSVGDPFVTKCGCQHRKCDISAIPACFQAGPSLRFAGG